jgi:hypothetical protein
VGRHAPLTAKASEPCALAETEDVVTAPAKTQAMRERLFGKLTLAGPAGALTIAIAVSVEGERTCAPILLEFLARLETPVCHGLLPLKRIQPSLGKRSKPGMDPVMDQ